MRLPTPSDFNFRATVESHGWYRLAPFVWSDGVLRRKERVNGRTIELKLDETLGGIPKTLHARVRRMLQLDVDLSEFHALARTKETHAWVAREKFGRLLCGTTLFEDAIKIIATTNTMWRQTVRMVELLVDKCGRDGAFPDPEDVARFSVEELQNDCRLGYRAKTMHALASGVADGSIDLATISNPKQTTEQLFKSYLQLPGIGPYGAAHLLAMDGRHDFIAVDSEFRRFVRTHYHAGRKVSDAALLRHYAKWGRWKYLAYWSELWAE